jgi:Ni/Fe-hydrogenase 1 B-type cytochrome subunit
MNATREFVRLYVWEAPVRLFHWVNAASLLVLCVTGYLIGHPWAFMNGGDASSSYWFGTLRFVHFAAGYVFVAAMVLRLYWAFAGNKFARWSNFLPLTRYQVREVGQVIKIEMLQVSNEPLDPIGHNAVAYFTYTGTFLLAAFSIVSGFALYSQMSAAWFPAQFHWVVPLFGSEANLRFWHHAAMWGFILFIMIHVYLSIYEDYIDGHGAISSMIGGWKFMDRRAVTAPRAQGISPLGLRRPEVKAAHPKSS